MLDLTSETESGKPAANIRKRWQLRGRVKRHLFAVPGTPSNVARFPLLTSTY